VNERVQAVDLETGEIKDLTSGTYPRYSPTGHLLFVEAGGSTLLAAPFDVDRLELTGSAVPVVEGLHQHTADWYQFYALSQSGRLVYRTDVATATDVTPVWVERDGTFREIDPGWTLPFEQDMSSFALSPDATRLAVSARGPEGTVDIYVKELDTGPLTRLTFEGAVNRGPTWSPDGRSVTFVSNRAGQDDLWMRRADGSGRAELVLDMDEPITEALYSPDGEWLLFIMGELNYGGSIYGIRLGVDSVPTLLVVSEDSRAAEMSLSPDGRWLAYYSNMLGDTPLDDPSSRVWVQPFPDVDSGSLWQISTTTSDGPEWAHSGRELFYNSDFPGTQDFMVAEVSLEPTFAVGQQRVLFSGVGYFQGVLYLHSTGHDEKVSLDDQRFVMLREIEVADNQLILVENWFEELRQRMGSN
jgi:Tol biopolymer transport system component